MKNDMNWTKKLLIIAMSAILLVIPVPTEAAQNVGQNGGIADANQYKAFHDTYDENDPDQRFQDALNLQFYNLELDIMVDTQHTTYEGPEYPDYIQGQVKLYVKHDAAAWPNTRDLYKYIEDVAVRINQNGGSVHGDGSNIVINLDMKTANSPNYQAVAASLQALFQHYQGIISYGYVADHQSYTEQAVTICLSGADGLKDAYFEYVQASTGKLLAFKDEVYSVTDSRRNDVAAYFPNEADIYHRFYAIHWKHIESGFDLLLPGNWSQEEEERLQEMLTLANQKGYTIRFYSLNGNEGAWHYKFPNGDGEAAQRWTQFAYINHKLGTRHFVSTDSAAAMTQLYDHFLVPLRDYNHRVEKEGGTQNGEDISVSITDDKRVVEVHKAEGAFNNNLWYSVGTVQDDGYIQWNTNRRINPAGSNKNGKQPHSDVAKIGDQYIVVQVNQTDGIGSGLWTNVGRLNSDNTITWFTNERIAVAGQNSDGEWPHVAIEGNNIVLIYRNGGNLYYNTGEIDTVHYKVNWKARGNVDGQSGERPDVAIKDNKIIVVYRNQQKLNYTTGTLNGNGHITWEANGQMDGQDGKDPTVTFLDNNKIIELHTSENTNLIWYNTGEVNWPYINWVNNNIWDSGASSKPDVAYDPTNQIFIDVHKSGWNYSLWYNTGKINDR